MALKILEFFGYSPGDVSIEAAAARKGLLCPFIGSQCTKTLNDGLVSGACTVRQMNSTPIICCPKRLYAGAHQILQDTANAVFGPGLPFIPGNKIDLNPGNGRRVFAFGS